MSIVDKDGFLENARGINNWILSTFGWLFSWGCFLMVLTCAAIFCSPVGKIRIGGNDAKPILSRPRWFAITLCSTVATGILFWGPAEPIYHIQQQAFGVNPEDAETFAMSTMYLHWSFTPYAIYAIPTIAFALAFYNRKLPFSLASTLFPFFKKQPPKAIGTVIDMISLFALVAGMSASLGTGLLILMGGVTEISGVEKTTLLLGLICIVTVASFVISASTGLMRGIKNLSMINMVAFIVIALLIFVLGPTGDVVKLGAEGAVDYVTHFPQKNLQAVLYPDDQWAYDWTVFYFAVWLAWAPIAAMFLGRISIGYTVREVLVFNWIIPSLFSMTWMAIFSGTALSMQASGEVDLIATLADEGTESVLYTVIGQFPMASVLIVVFVAVVFLSYVTAADSNTEAMGAICTKGISAEKASPPAWIKIVWGVIIGATSFIMVTYAGIDGIKMISNIGGFSTLWLVLLIMEGLIIVLFNHKTLSEPSKESGSG